MNYQKLKVFHKNKKEIMLCKRDDGKFMVIEQPIIIKSPYEVKQTLFINPIQAETYYNLIKQDKQTQIIFT